MTKKHHPKPADEDDTVQIAVRLNSSLVQEIDAYGVRLGKSSPGMEFTRSQLIRSLIRIALDAKGG